MSQHMVIFQTADGSPAYSQFESVSEAVGFVESLRNDQGIENARMFELKEIKFELKPVFKVELLELNPGPAAAPKPAAAAASAPSTAPAAPARPAAPASGETTTFGTTTPPAGRPAAPSAPSAPSAPAPSAAPGPEPAAPADAPADGQPARRGLFGR